MPWSSTLGRTTAALSVNALQLQLLALAPHLRRALVLTG
jgi:hypothetical protein